MNKSTETVTDAGNAPRDERSVYLTRTDNNVGAGSFDSIQWAFETHVKEQDTGEYNYAVLYGNEDSPRIIDFYVKEPKWNSNVDRVWTPNSSEKVSANQKLRSTWFYKHQGELEAIQSVVGSETQAIEIFNAIKRAGFKISRKPTAKEVA